MKNLFERIKGPMDPDFSGVRFPQPDPDSLSELFHENSKLHPIAGPALGARIEMFLSHKPLQTAAAHPYKVYTNHDRIALPAIRPLTASLETVLTQRRSVRNYQSDQPLPIEHLADWLGWGCGWMPNLPETELRPGRTYPSGGGLYPLEIYLATRNVAELPVGLYHYSLREHALERVGGEESGQQVLANLTQTDAASSCHAAVLISAIFMRTQYKYGERGYRFVLLEAGHLMQNLCLLAPALGLGITPVGGYYDDQLHHLLEVNGVDEAVVYTATMGLPGA